MEVHYHNDTASAKTLSAVLLCASGQTVYMDCVQVEKTPTASRYNILQNSDFNLGSYWSGTGFTEGDARMTAPTQAAPQLSRMGIRMYGSPTAQKKVRQAVPVSGVKGDTYVVAGWALADSVPLNTENEAREFGIRLVFNNTDGTTTSAVAQFNCDTNTEVNWQYSAAVAVAEKAYSSIDVEAVYDYNANIVYFDGIQLYKEEFSQSYTYDDDGNVISVVDLQKQETTYEYENNDLTKEILPSGAELKYEYDDYHNVTKATSSEGIVYNFTYDDYGNNTSVEIVNGSTSIKSSAVYSDDGNRMVSATDATNQVTTYGYNENTNMLEWVKYPRDSESTRTNYTYDSMYRMATAAATAAAATTDTRLALSANYTYTDDLLTKIQTPSTAYSFTYTYFGLRRSVKIGSRTLAVYSYTDNTTDSGALDYSEEQDFYLRKLAYGNGDSVQYEYDQQGRVTKQTYEDGATVEYRYDNNGALATVTDSATGASTTYYYDFIDRMMKYVETGGDHSHSVSYEYDTINNLTKLAETIDSTAYTYAYSYDDDNRVTAVTNTNAKRFYTYDLFGRVSTQTTKHGSDTVKTDSFTFTAPKTGTTSSQIASHTVDAADYSSDAEDYNKTYTYAYDKNGNIRTVTFKDNNTNNTNTTTYLYDTANQLVRENNEAGNFTHVWTYDNAGNILSRTEYGYTTGEPAGTATTVNYTYGDSEWGDLLTGYNGSTITYDRIGNPLNDGTWTYTWQHGRQLASMSDGSTTWNFTYNADGLRTKRTNGSTTYEYVYNGDKLSYMKSGSIQMYFIYDASGTPIALRRNNANYYYVTNVQGDVIAILNSVGSPVVEYTYDAWGNLISTTGSMATTLGVQNPLRYRSYVYDTEYEFYYLSTRYYNPNVGRFLNADNATYLGADGTLLSYNLFSYCKNAPVLSKDISGNFGVVAAVAAITVTGAIVGGLMGAFTAATTGGNVIESAIEGCLTGAAGALCGLLISNPAVAIGAAFAGGFAIDVATQCASNKSIDLKKVDYGRSAKTGALTGLGTAIPQFGAPTKSATDAFATALIWSEGSALIASADVITTKVKAQMPQKPSRKDIIKNAVKATTVKPATPIINRYATPWAVYYT